jgi:hypothetical protein
LITRIVQHDDVSLRITHYGVCCADGMDKK